MVYIPLTSYRTFHVQKTELSKMNILI